MDYRAPHSEPSVDYVHKAFNWAGIPFGIAILLVGAFFGFAIGWPGYFLCALSLPIFASCYLHGRILRVSGDELEVHTLLTRSRVGSIKLDSSTQLRFVDLPTGARAPAWKDLVIISGGRRLAITRFLEAEEIAGL